MDLSKLINLKNHEFLKHANRNILIYLSLNSRKKKEFKVFRERERRTAHPALRNALIFIVSLPVISRSIT